MSSPSSVPLSALGRGERGILKPLPPDDPASAVLSAMGLGPEASVRVCRRGEPCIVAIEAGPGSHCRIGLARRLASRVMVTPVGTTPVGTI